MKPILKLIGLATLILTVVWVGTGWMPEAQIERKTGILLRAGGDRDWKKVGRLMSDDYRDAWGLNKTEALELAGEAGRHFFTLMVTPSGPVRVAESGGSGQWIARLAFGGRGTALGEAMLSRASTFRMDFVFAWKRESWKPWDWKLVSVRQPEITLDSQWMP